MLKGAKFKKILQNVSKNFEKTWFMRKF